MYANTNIFCPVLSNPIALFKRYYLDASKGTLGELRYFFKCIGGEIHVMSNHEAAVSHPNMVLDFLESCIA